MNIVSTQGNTLVLKFSKRFFEKISLNNTPSQFEGIEFLPQTLIFNPFFYATRFRRPLIF